MPGSTKKRVMRLRESGSHDLADWLELREKARADGAVLWKWDKENPKPGTDELQDKRDRFKSKLNDVNYFKGQETFDNISRIPEFKQNILRDIAKAKEKLKGKVHGMSEDELKTAYKVIKKLDVEEKKIVFEYDFKAFDEYFFSDIQDRVPTAQFHYEMIGLYESSSRACVICPRGHAKSTTARKYIVWQLVYKKFNYAILGGASEDMAAQNLRWIRDQLTDNEKIVDIYGWLKNKDKWADTEFQTNNGIKLTAKGAGQKIRGANEKGRPDLFYFDDLEEDEQVSSRDRREKLRKWFSQAVMPAKSRNGRIIITGTILHLDSLLKNISDNKVKDHLPWQVLFYQAISKDEDGHDVALWEEHKPLSELKLLRETDPETFSQEYQNSPASGSMAVFNREEYSYIDPSEVVRNQEDGRVYVRGRPVNLLMTSDLAISVREGADYTVFMMSGMDDESNLYVLQYERFRSSDPYEQMEVVFDMLKNWGCDCMSMETIAFLQTFKRMFEYEMKKRNLFFYIHEVVRQNIRKIFRIKSLKAPIRAGKIYWQHDHVEIEEELSQVTATSLGLHDDVIDCLADSWEVQVELNEDKPNAGSPINTVAWMIEQGMLPTVQEQEDLALYG